MAGGGKAPKPVVRETPDPNAEAEKKKAGEQRAKVQAKRGSARTIATGPQGVLGAAPVSRPELRSSLG